MLDLPEIVVEPGSLLNASFPAPVAARANTCQRIVDVVIGALAEALPEQVVGAANGANTTAVFSGVDPRSNSQYVYLETLGGGFGGRAAKDGTDGVQVHITNTSNLPVELIEMEYPLLVESYSLIEDSGGPGRFRGGMGLRRAIRPVGHDCTFNGAIERSAHKPWGVFGGGSGAPGRFLHVAQDGTLTVLPTKPAGVLVRESETIVVESPGAGGYGPPRERSRAAIEIDRLNGKFSDDLCGPPLRASARRRIVAKEHHPWNFSVPQPIAVLDLTMSDGATVHVRRHGNAGGPRLVLSHGNGFAIDAYFPFWCHFLHDCEVVVFDQRNHGWNPRHDASGHTAAADGRRHGDHLAGGSRANSASAAPSGPFTPCRQR